MLLGTLVGILPGISPSLTVALLLPVTFKLDPTGSIIMFAGIYFGGMYGSSTTAILLNTPGEAASIATAIEGHKMARAGRGGPALATAAIGSFVAGTHRHPLPGTAGALASSTSRSRFGPWDYFGLMVLAFVTISATFGSSVLRGLTSLALGLVLGLSASTSSPARRGWPTACRRCSTAFDHDAGRGPVRDGRGAVRRLALHRRRTRRSKRCAARCG